MAAEVNVYDCDGTDIYALASELYPICRSITGRGLRQTLELIGKRIPLEVTEIATGSSVFDWEVPDEWNIEDAWIKDSHGEKIVDFQQHNLHIMGYSEPANTTLSLQQLQARLYSLPDTANWIPYRTSYYNRNWGFCLRHKDRLELLECDYEIAIRSDLSPGVLSYGECFLAGRSKREILLYTHICHPSLANDNTSGMAILTKIAEWLASEDRRFSYRIVFAPGTIGSLCWLKNNESRLGRISHGLVLGLLGDAGSLTYKASRNGAHEIDQIVPYALRQSGDEARLIPFDPYGYDERQFCSPGFDLPVGRLTRSTNDGYAEYHSSADDLEFISARNLDESYQALRNILRTLESNVHYQNLLPKGEPRLGKRGLYGSVGGRSPAESEHAMLWVLSQSDGSSSLVDIAKRSGLQYRSIQAAAESLRDVGILDVLE